MPKFIQVRVERVLAGYAINAESLEAAIKADRAGTADFNLQYDECTDVHETWWEDENGNVLTEQAAAINARLDDEPATPPSAEAAEEPHLPGCPATDGFGCRCGEQAEVSP